MVTATSTRDPRTVELQQWAHRTLSRGLFLGATGLSVYLALAFGADIWWILLEALFVITLLTAIGAGARWLILHVRDRMVRPQAPPLPEE